MLSRALSLQYLSLCDGMSDRSLPFPFSIWSGFGFGESHGYYLRGAVIGNLVSVVVFAFVCLFFGCIMVAIGQANGLEGNMLVRATVFTMMPSSICIAIAVILDGTVFASVNLLSRANESPSPAVDAVIALIGFLVPIGFLAFVLRGLSRAMGVDSERGGLKYGPSYVTTHVDICLTRFARGNLGRFLLFGSSGWFSKLDAGSSFGGAMSQAAQQDPAVRRYGMLLRSIRGPSTLESESWFPPLRYVQFYFFFDAFATVLTAAIRGALAGRNCELILWLTSVILVLIFLTSLFVRPFIVPFKALITNLVNAAAAAGAIALAVYYSGDQTGPGRQLAEITSLAASGLCCLLPALFVLRKLVLCCLGAKLTPSNNTFVNDGVLSDDRSNGFSKEDGDFALSVITGGAASLREQDLLDGGNGANERTKHLLDDLKNSRSTSSSNQHSQQYTPPSQLVEVMNSNMPNLHQEQSATFQSAPTPTPPSQQQQQQYGGDNYDEL